MNEVIHPFDQIIKTSEREIRENVLIGVRHAREDAVKGQKFHVLSFKNCDMFYQSFPLVQRTGNLNGKGWPGKATSLAIRYMTDMIDSPKRTTVLFTSFVAILVTDWYWGKLEIETRNASSSSNFHFVIEIQNTRNTYNVLFGIQFVKRNKKHHWLL